MKTRQIAAAFFGSVCLITAGHAQQSAAGVPDALPQAMTTQNGITYVCGGVGSDEAARMKAAARDYNLMLTFADRSGAYVSDVNVDIADARGHALLTTKCDGPIMLVDVPNGGRYRVRGELAGRTVSATAVVRPHAKGTPVHLVLPQEPPIQG